MASDGAAAATAAVSGLRALPPPASRRRRRTAPGAAAASAQRCRPLRQARKLVGGARHAAFLSRMVHPGPRPPPRRWQPSPRLSERYVRALQGLGGCWAAWRATAPLPVGPSVIPAAQPTAAPCTPHPQHA